MVEEGKEKRGVRRTLATFGGAKYYFFSMNVWD